MMGGGERQVVEGEDLGSFEVEEVKFGRAGVEEAFESVTEVEAVADG
jgi:hypothetical protein